MEPFDPPFFDLNDFPFCFDLDPFICPLVTYGILNSFSFFFCFVSLDTIITFPLDPLYPLKSLPDFREEATR
jgi:hypothetical protein